MQISEIQIFKWCLINANFQFQQNFCLLKYIQIQYRKKKKKKNSSQFEETFDDNILICDIYRSYHTKRFSLIVFPFPSWASFKVSVIPTTLHPALMIFFPFLDLRRWYISVINFAWCGFKVDKRKSTLMVVTSRSRSFP